MKSMLAVGSVVVLGAVSAVALAAEPVRLAMLTEVSGKVLVNNGKGYVSAKSGTQLKEGDRVISLDGSHAAVVYADGCTTNLSENSLLAVEGAQQCGKAAVRTGAVGAAGGNGVQSAKSDRILLAQAMGGKSDAGKKDEDDKKPVVWWASGGGGVAGILVLAGAGAAIVSTGDSKPLSNH